ncbi:MAG: tail fiber protein [Bacteroidales bacterium]
MNRINFTAKESFPLSSDTMDLMQQMITLNAAIAQLGGVNYILSGCDDDGSTVSPGIIVINGELLPFEGGAKKAKITIAQTTKTLTAFGVEYPEAYVYRMAKFADAGEHTWADFVQVLSNKELETKINNLKVEEPGFVKMWSGRVDRIPTDYRLCTGEILLKADYPQLAYALGKETEESFALPDLRRRFVAGYDSELFSEYNYMWATGGEEKVTLTIDEMPNHSHDIKFIDEIWGDNANHRPFPNPAGTSGYVAATSSVGGGEAHENRPPFFVLAYVIKVK